MVKVFDLSKNTFWIESFFNYIPINNDNTIKQLLLRFSFVFFIWFSGLLFFAADGLSQTFLSQYRLQTNLFTTSFIILIGTRFVSRSLNTIIPKLRPIIKITDSEFSEFSRKLNQIIFSFLPILIITVFFLFLESSLVSSIQAVFTEGIHFYLLWNMFYNIFYILLSGTAYWMLASIWLTIFLVSRQPLEIVLSTKPNEQFRDLSKLALAFSFFYFISITIIILSSSIVITYPFSISEILFSPNTLYILIGSLGILLPFYNIHTALLKHKRKQIEKNDEESSILINQLDETLKFHQKNESDPQIIVIMAQLYKLQLKKKQMELASEWPVDITFLSRFAGVILIPIVARIFLELMNRSI